MKLPKIMLIILVLCSISALSSSCNYESEAAVPENEVATVQRGDMLIDITADGNLALSAREDLAFQIAGFVEEILVEEGDAVTEGQVLVSLDTTSLELAVKEEEIDLEIATSDFREITYPYTYHTLAFDVPTSIADIRDAQRQLTEAQEALEIGLSYEQYWDVWNNLRDAQENLVEARAYLTKGYGADVFSWAPVEKIKSKNVSSIQIYPVEDYWTLREKELKMEKAQLDLDEANNDLADAVIVAPFDGVITEVNVSRGKKVSSGTVAVQIADPDKFEVEVEVSETDIFHVKRGGEAWVQVDVLPGVSLPAKVTQISPTATIEADVVNYKVKVEIESLQAVIEEWQQVRQEEAMQVMIIQWLEGQGGQQETPTMPEAFQLRDGLTITVNLVLEERNNVLLVPSEAITYQEGKTYVHVLQDGVIEPCLITTGISNCQYTEVTNGLNAGKQVIVH